MKKTLLSLSFVAVAAMAQAIVTVPMKVDAGNGGGGAQNCIVQDVNTPDVYTNPAGEGHNHCIVTILDGNTPPIVQSYTIQAPTAIPADHKIFAVDYKSTANCAQGFMWHVHNGNLADNWANLDVTIQKTDEWKTVYYGFGAKRTAAFANGDYKWYMRFGFMDWQNPVYAGTKFEFKNPRYITNKEYEAEIAGEPVEPYFFAFWINESMHAQAMDDLGLTVYNVGGDTASMVSYNGWRYLPRHDENNVVAFEYKSTVPGGIMRLACGGPGLVPYYSLSTFEDAKYQLEATCDDEEIWEEDGENPEIWKTLELPLTDGLATAWATAYDSGDCVQIIFDGFPRSSDDESAMFAVKNMRFDKSSESTGIDAVESAAETVATRYYDLQGRQLNAVPETGLFLQQEIKADGSVKTVKAVK